MKNFLQQINSYIKEAFNAGKYLYNGLSVTFDHLRRRPVTVQYPYEKLIPSERYRGRIHYEFDKCIACEVSLFITQSTTGRFIGHTLTQTSQAIHLSNS